MDYVEYFIPHKETYFIHSLFKNMNSNVFRKTITVLLSVTQITVLLNSTAAVGMSKIRRSVFFCKPHSRGITSFDCLD